MASGDTRSPSPGGINLRAGAIGPSSTNWQEHPLLAPMWSPFRHRRRSSGRGCGRMPVGLVQGPGNGMVQKGIARKPTPPRGRGPPPVDASRTRGGAHTRPGYLPLLEGKLGRLRIDGVAHLGVVEHRHLGQVTASPLSCGQGDVLHHRLHPDLLIHEAPKNLPGQPPLCQDHPSQESPSRFPSRIEGETPEYAHVSFGLAYPVKASIANHVR